MVAVALAIAAALPLSFLGEGVPESSGQIAVAIAWVGSGAIGAAAVVGYLWWGMRNPTVVSIDGPWLSFVKGGKTSRARLEPGSLVAGRRSTGPGDSSYGSTLCVRFEDGRMLTMHVPAMLPDDCYSTNTTGMPDLFVEPGAEANSLLMRLLPFIMTRAPTMGRAPTKPSASVATYTIPLVRFNPPFYDSGPASRNLYIVGDSVGLGDVGSPELLTRARVADISVVAFSYARNFEAVSFHCPGISLRFPAGTELRLGTTPVDTKEDWWGRPVRKLDTSLIAYQVGEAEFLKLVDALGLPRRR